MNSREIEADAGAWLHRKDVGPWDAPTQAAFEQWLNGSPRHRVAFLRLESAWERSHRLTALRRPDGHPPARESLLLIPRVTPSATRNPYRYTRLGWVAAVILAAVSLASWWLSHSSGRTYTTPIGAVESVPMPDGSIITLNTATRIHVGLTADARTVDLEAGEAVFEVAKDAHRPFVVHVSHRRIIAVGTQFSVRRKGDNIQVVVTDGTVRIEGDRGPGATRAELATAGTIARTNGDAIILTSVSPSSAEDSLSWRRGILVFHDTPLAEALSEINRYNEVQLRLTDDTAARQLIAGEVRSTNVDAFVRLIERAYHLRAERSDNVIVLRPASP